MDKQLELLELVIDYFVKKWSPIWSKFLYSSGDIDLAPSTIRKYLNILEKEGFVYQPHQSAWRLPTIKWIDKYIRYISEKWFEIVEYDSKQMEYYRKRDNLRSFVELLWDIADGISFGFFNDDDYYFLWVWNLLKKAKNDIEKVIPLMDFVEKKRIVSYLQDKNISKDKISYDFIWYSNITIVTMYVKVPFEHQDAVIGIVGPLRLDYKKNLAIMQKFIDNL